MARRRYKGRRQRGRNVTVAVMISGSGETKHRGRTVAQAFKIAEHARLRSGCHFKWYKIKGHTRSMYRLPGRVAGMDGAVVCDGRRTGDVFALVYRPRAKYTGSGKVSRRA